MPRYFVKMINKYLAEQGKSLPNMAEAVMVKDVSQLTEEEARWYRENLLPHESFFVDILKKQYSREKKPEKWLNRLQKGARASIVGGMAEKALDQLGVEVRAPLEVTPPAPVSGVGFQPQAGSTEVAGGAAGRDLMAGPTPPPPAGIPQGAFVPPPPPLEVKPPEIPTAPAEPVVVEGLEEAVRETPSPAGIPQGAFVPPPPPLEVKPPDGEEVSMAESPAEVWASGKIEEMEDIKGTFSIQAEDKRGEDLFSKPELGVSEGPKVGMEPLQPGAGLVGARAEMSPAGPDVHGTVSYPVVDNRHAWVNAAEGQPVYQITDHRYELERGPEVPVLREAEIVAPVVPWGAAPEERGGLKAWIAAHKKLVISIASGLLLLGVGIFLLFFFLAGEKTVYEWSISQRLGRMVRVERQLSLKKKAGGYPYLYTVNVKLENIGGEPIKIMQVEEVVPHLLLQKGDLDFSPEPVRESEEEGRFGWVGRSIDESDCFEISYSLGLQAELSEPQREEIEEHFNQNIIAGVFLPENFETCSACEGKGSSTCQVCNGMGTVTCPTCGGVGNTTCATCRGQGQVTCSRCQGDGIYYQCPVCGTIVQGYFDDCPTCGRSWT